MRTRMTQSRCGLCEFDEYVAKHSQALQTSAEISGTLSAIPGSAYGTFVAFVYGIGKVAGASDNKALSIAGNVDAAFNVLAIVTGSSAEAEHVSEPGSSPGSSSIESTREVVDHENLESHVSDKTPLLKEWHGRMIGDVFGRTEYTLALGQFPANQTYVEGHPGAYTIDRPWGWTLEYNIAAVQAHLDADGPVILLTPDNNAGSTYPIEVRQVMAHRLNKIAEGR